MDFDVPVITGLTDKHEEQFTGFLQQLKDNPEAAAEYEAKRLVPYLEALGAQLKNDLEKTTVSGLARDDLGYQTRNPDLFSKSPDDSLRERMEKLTSSTSLSGLFSDISKKTKSTILSEMMIMPNFWVNTMHGHDDVQIFSKSDVYRGRAVRLGFMQVVPPHENGKSKATVSVPFVALDDDVVKDVGYLKNGERILRLVQDVMLAGNHDMQHHYTNDTLNAAIATRNLLFLSDQSQHEKSIKAWSAKYFSEANDQDIDGYESWLIMNHAVTMERVMQNGGRERLRDTIDAYYTELGKAQKKLKKENGRAEANEQIDYLGMLLPYALMRFRPLDDPLIDQCFAYMERLIPLNEKEIAERAKAVRTQEITSVGFNYSQAGRKIYPAAPGDADYIQMKKMELVRMHYLIPMLLSPAVSDEKLAAVQKRVSAVNVDMVSSAAHNVWYSPIENGIWQSVDEKGARIEIHTKDGVPHRDDGPAIIWELEGIEYKEIWCQNGIIDRPEGGPAVVSKVNKAGAEFHEYYENGLKVKSEDVLKNKNGFANVDRQQKYVRDKDLPEPKKSLRSEQNPQLSLNLYSSDKGQAGVPVEIPDSLIAARAAFMSIENATELPDRGMIENVIYNISNNLENGGFGYASLDPYGEASENEMKVRFDKAAANLYVLRARESFESFKRSENYVHIHQVYDCLHGIQKDLGKAKADMSALDPTGKKTEAQMEHQVDGLYKQAFVNIAREAYKQLFSQENASDFNKIKDIKQKIDTALKETGGGYEILEPDNVLSDAQIREKIQKHGADLALNAARNHYKGLHVAVKSENNHAVSVGYIDIAFTSISRLLRDAGCELSDLDPQGKRTSADIEAEFEKMKDSVSKSKRHQNTYTRMNGGRRFQ